MTLSADPSTRSVLRRHAARACLVLGVVFAVALFAPAIPEDQTVVFRLDSNDVKSLSATFTPRGDDEPVSGVTLWFEGQVPREVRHEVALPNGEYLLGIDLSRNDRPSAAQTSSVRPINLSGGVTTVFVNSRQP